jgi:hypothetical protein
MESSTAAARDAAPRVSVIVATRNRADALANAVASILASEHPSFELIVMDQGDDERARSVIEAAADPRAIYVRDAERGQSAAINGALARARGALIAFTDDDCTVSPDWIAEVERAFDADPEAGVLFGVLRAAPHDPTESFIPGFEPAESRRLAGRGDARFEVSRGAPAGGDMAARAELFRRVGPFDPCLSPGGRFFTGADTDLQHRALRAGFAVLHEPACVVTHWGSRPLAGGAAAKLVRGARFGRGAILAKELRLGEPRALARLAGVVAGDLGTVAVSLVRRGRLTGAGRMAHTLRGFVAGLRQPLDRRRGVFRCGAEPPALPPSP